MRSYWIPKRPSNLPPDRCGRQTLTGKPCMQPVPHPGDACGVHRHTPGFVDRHNSESPWPQPPGIDPEFGMLLSAGIELSGLNLSHRTLIAANLAGCTMSGADLRGTKLDMANLRGANLSRCLVDVKSSFTAAIYDEDTKWPDDGPQWPPAQANFSPIAAASI